MLREVCCCLGHKLGHLMRLWGQAGLVSSQVAGADGEEATGGAGRVAQWWRQACALPSSQPGYELVPKELTSIDTIGFQLRVPQLN